MEFKSASKKSNYPYLLMIMIVFFKDPKDSNKRILDLKLDPISNPVEQHPNR
jgi:hypothetical protein